MSEAAASSETPALAEAASQPAPPLAPYLRQLRPALVGLVLLTLITGGVYPAVVYGVGRFVFPDQADGSLLRRDGVVLGSRLIGQPFSRPEYFQPRPSAAGNGYDATQSGGTNLAPANPKLASAVTAAADAYRKLNGLPANALLPIDAVTSSGSGLDPHISPENAALQVARVAKARGMSEATVRELLVRTTEGRDLGVIGQPRVNVLALNLALDRAAPMAKGAAR